MEPAGPGTAPPPPGTYWVVEGALLAGQNPGSPDPEKAGEKIRALRDAGVRTVVNLMEETELDHHGNPFTPYEPLLKPPERMVRRPIRDLNVPTVDEMAAILDLIDQSRTDGAVYVHCWGGGGRTGTTVGCWLLRHGLATPDDVLDVLAHLRRTDTVHGDTESPETADQRSFVRGWPEP